MVLELFIPAREFTTPRHCLICNKNGDNSWGKNLKHYFGIVEQLCTNKRIGAKKIKVNEKVIKYQINNIHWVNYSMVITLTNVLDEFTRLVCWSVVYAVNIIKEYSKVYIYRGRDKDCRH